VSKSAEIHTGSLVLAVLLMVSTGASAETLTGTVVDVADGDTITVLDANREQHKIRVAGIDVPEKAQPFGQRSKDSMSAMVFGKEVDVHWHTHATSASSAR
jgi:endonuclease YncB( thermonuclease family)